MLQAVLILPASFEDDDALDSIDTLLPKPLYRFTRIILGPRTPEEGGRDERLSRIDAVATNIGDLTLCRWDGGMETARTTDVDASSTDNLGLKRLLGG